MRVSYDEDLANHIGPKSCMYPRKVVREAMTGECAGWVIRREKGFSKEYRRRQRVRKASQ